MTGNDLNESNSSEPLSQAIDPLASNSNKRPVSMYETREGLHATKSQPVDNNRTASSMYQMIDAQTSNATTNGHSTLPRSEDVKHQTEIVTRRIQELWQLMQEHSSKDAFVPGAERIRVAVIELTSLFPTVKLVFHLVLSN